MEGKGTRFALDVDLVREGSRSLKGKLADWVFQSIYYKSIEGKIRLMSISDHLPSGIALMQRGEWRTQTCYPMREIINRWLGFDPFTDEDLKFLFTKVHDGKGPPSFDYRGVEVELKHKVLADLKSRWFEHLPNELPKPMYSDKEEKMISDALSLGFKVYTIHMLFYGNFKVRIVFADDSFL